MVLRAPDEVVAASHVELEKLEVAFDALLETWEGVRKRLHARIQTLEQAVVVGRMYNVDRTRRIGAPRRLVRRARMGNGDGILRMLRDVHVDTMVNVNMLLWEFDPHTDYSWIDGAQEPADLEEQQGAEGVAADAETHGGPDAPVVMVDNADLEAVAVQPEESTMDMLLGGVGGDGVYELGNPDAAQLEDSLGGADGDMDVLAGEGPM